MAKFTFRQFAAALALCATLSACGGGGSSGDSPAPAVSRLAWSGFARDAQHSAQSTVAAQALTRTQWQAAVDKAPQYASDGSLPIHFGSPVISAHNTVLVPVKTGSDGGFRVEARAGVDG